MEVAIFDRRVAASYFAIVGSHTMVTYSAIFVIKVRSQGLGVDMSSGNV
jgi:hypothetical protein